MPSKILVSNDYVKQLYEQFSTTKAGINTIAKQENRSPHTIQKWFDEAGYITKVDDSYFDVIDSEDKAYYLGLMYSDGCISYSSDNRQPIIKIALVEDDAYILNNIRQSVQPFKPLYPINFKNANNKRQLVFALRSSHMANSLEQLGCPSNKSQNNKEDLVWPNLDAKYYRHFVRGFFDGDGTIIFNRKGRVARPVEFYGVSKSFMYSLKDYLQLGSMYKREYKNKQTVYRLSIHQYDEIINLRKFLYEPAFIYLKRKWERFYGMAVPIKYPFYCPKCSSNNFKKNGRRNNKIRLICTDCGTHYTY